MDTEIIVLSLTSVNSHCLVLEPGVGSVTIGPIGSGYELIVQPDSAIDWSVFDSITTPSGIPWPRAIYYTGSDLGVFSWAKNRSIETLEFSATGPVEVDAREAAINHLAVKSNGWPITVQYRASQSFASLTLIGESSDFTLGFQGSVWPPRLGYSFPDTPGPNRFLGPDEAFNEISSLTIASAPMGRAFDCESLSCLPALTDLTFHGALTNAKALASLSLTDLAFRFVPDLSGVPSLSAWPDLNSFVAYNVDDVTGRRLRTELKKISPPLEFGSVSQLRAARWFIEEYGLPFTGWTRKNAAAATKAYRVASAALDQSDSDQSAHRAIVDFVATINSLPSIETIEREDAGEAVRLLALTGDIDPALAQDWFDQTRDF